MSQAALEHPADVISTPAVQDSSSPSLSIAVPVHVSKIPAHCLFSIPDMIWHCKYFWMHSNCSCAGSTTGSLMTVTFLKYCYGQFIIHTCSFRSLCDTGVCRVNEYNLQQMKRAFSNVRWGWGLPQAAIGVRIWAHYKPYTRVPLISFVSTLAGVELEMETI